jgi:pyrimidine-nucleoside phosphorylase
MLRAVDIIIKKRDGAELVADEIRHMVHGAANGRVPDYQLAAWLMAIYLKGMTFSELASLTEAMVHSGEIYKLSSVPGRKVDKHSTGGVGDKVSLALAPLVAAAGVPVPMMAGRALGHTGGTLDKLESIPGFNVHLEKRAFVDQIHRIGVAMIGQSEAVAPADRKLYALRDVTGTVESIPLIAASIMSKKIAAGVEALVMDVKTGNGAFMAREKDAMTLAQTLVAVGHKVEMPVVALLTDMSQPLGRAVGNANEVAEAISVLKGEGPPDVRELVLALGAEMLLLGKRSGSAADARLELIRCIEAGKAVEKFAQLLEAQGGNPRVIDEPSLLGLHDLEEEIVTADRNGYISGFDTRAIGMASMILGAGRQRVDEEIDHSVGIYVEKKIGEQVAPGEAIFRILYRDRDRMAQTKAILSRALTFADRPLPPRDLVKFRIDASSHSKNME